MTESKTSSRGLSAAQASRITKRAKPPTDRVVRGYTILRDGKALIELGTFKDVKALLPGVREGLLRRRLEKGERDYDRLVRPPDSPAMRKRKMRPVSMYRRS